MTKLDLKWRETNARQLCYILLLASPEKNVKMS